MEKYRAERSTFFNAWSEFSCPDGCERYGCSEEGKARIPHHRIENLISKRFSEGGYLDDWEIKIEQLDRAGGPNLLTEMKRWTDQMAIATDRTSVGIAYQFDGNRLQPIRLYPPTQKTTGFARG